MDQTTIIINEDLSDKFHSALKNQFHLDKFRPGQLEAITTLIHSGRLLCIQPTGHGKSLLYQLPASILTGITIVISPLLALMRDQVEQLNQRFNISAASINSDQSIEENNQAQQSAAQGKLKILFVAPEKLDHLDYFNFLLKLPVELVVIDEAHCISTWGHDFRPSYRQIINFIHAAEQKNPQLKILAITATANRQTEEDVKNQLVTAQQTVNVQRQSMDRSNIQLSVIAASGLAEKLNTLLQLLGQLPGGGLIYCATRENTELVAEYLLSQGVHAAAYHAGLDPEKKRQLQRNFIDNQYKVISATNALGMGIDKQDLRFIIHFDMPGSITAYYQEVGRCGRNGELAQGILLFDEADKKIQNYFIDSAQPSAQDFKQVLQCVRDANEDLDLTSIKKLSGFHPTRVTIIIAELIEQGFLTKKAKFRKQLYCLSDKKNAPDLSRYENQLKLRTFELGEMVNYGKQKSVCLMKLLRQALGDVDANICGHCNICAPLTFSLKTIVRAITDIQRWLGLRVATIGSSTRNHFSEGVAVLNAQLRAPSFIEFMKSRTTAAVIHDQELLILIKRQLQKLKEQHSFSAVIPLPSRTWLGRDSTAQFIADFFGAKLLTDYLQWHDIPAARQGELLNNDQRRHNVHQRMKKNGQIIVRPGTVLLLDDYTGSGATLQEAVRVLRKEAQLTNAILPFTIAMVKWRLGRRGMI